MDEYFNLLECDERTPLKEIDKKYKNLMRKTHPDRGNDDKLCKSINEAYQYILDYKLNTLIDITDSLIPATFREMGFKNIPTTGQYIRKRIEMSKINEKSNGLTYEKKKLLLNKKKYLLKNKQEISKKSLSNNTIMLLESNENDSENDSENGSENDRDSENGSENDSEKFGDNDIESTFRKNLLTRKFIHDYEEKKEKGILENLLNYFF